MRWWGVRMQCAQGPGTCLSRTPRRHPPGGLGAPSWPTWLGAFSLLPDCPVSTTVSRWGAAQFTSGVTCRPERPLTTRHPSMLAELC